MTPDPREVFTGLLLTVLYTLAACLAIHVFANYAAGAKEPQHVPADARPRGAR